MANTYGKFQGHLEKQTRFMEKFQELGERLMKFMQKHQVPGN